MHHSGRVTLQNRRFLKVAPSSYQQPGLIPSAAIGNTPQPVVANPSTPVSDQLIPVGESPTPVSDQLITVEESPTPTAARPRRVPRMLKELESFNKPGLRE